MDLLNRIISTHWKDIVGVTEMNFATISWYWYWCIFWNSQKKLKVYTITMQSLVCSQDFWITIYVEFTDAIYSYYYSWPHHLDWNVNTHTKLKLQSCGSKKCMVANFFGIPLGTLIHAWVWTNCLFCGNHVVVAIKCSY